MRPKLIAAACIAASLLSPMGLQKPRAQSAEQARVIVKYRADAPLMHAQALTAAGKRLSQMQTLGQRVGTALTAGTEISDRMHVVHAIGMTSAELAAKLSADSEIEYAVPEGRKHIVAVPNDPFYAGRAYNNATAPTSGGPLVGQWYLKPPGASGTQISTAPSAINAEAAWDLTTGSAGIVVADLDTGLRFDHPDLQGGNVLKGYDMISADSVGNFTTANDGDGRDIDASDPGDWVPTTSATTACPAENSSWHGTQTLGLIGAATGNGIGMASVGRGVRVMPVRVLGRCGGSDGDIIAAMLWAAGLSNGTSRPSDVLSDNLTPARVLNMSLGEAGFPCNQAYQDAVDKIIAAGTVIVVAAGNSGGHAIGAPANCNGVIAVGALRSVGDKVGFSDMGADVTISAPGGNCITTTAGAPCIYPILTTANSGLTTPVLGALGAIYTDSFNPSIGTSFSTPLVAGTVALMLSLQPTMTPAQVKSVLQKTARPFPTTGGTVGITVATAAPTATKPVGLTATEPGQCVAPTATDQSECYCTTTTCGAGMLDAYAAVNNIAGGGPGGTRRNVAYHWTLVSGGGIVTVLAGADTASASATPTGPGTFTVSLASTDDVGLVSTTTSTVTVAAAPVVVPPAPSSSGGGGGGAIGIGWLALLLAAIGALVAIDRSELKARSLALSAPVRSSRRR